MTSHFAMIVGFSLAMLFAQTALAADSCTIMYRVDATLEATDTQLQQGDTVVEDVRGSLVVEYPKDRQGRVVDGKVKVLHYATYESFKIDSVVTITTTIHHFTPRCNGSDSPTWRRTSDEGFPTACRYTGNSRPVAVGFLRKDDGVIEWGKCKAAPSYWAGDREAYTFSSQSKGKGCLKRMHAVGNIDCDGRLACKWGGLNRGDNPQFDVWTQPLVHGPPGSDHSVTISPDLSTIRTPVDRSDGRQSYNLPNDAPSRTWFSWVATRDDSSPFTTCPQQ